MAALVAELAAGLLLFAADGFLQALTLVLAVGLGSLGLGLLTAPSGPSLPEIARSLRRRWFLVLAALGVAGGLSVVWSLGAGLQQTPPARGLALAFLEAFPLYAVGTVLGAVQALHPGSRSGAMAALGGALGVVLEGSVLLVRFEPVSIYLLCIVLLSGSALVHGRAVLALVAPPPQNPEGPP